MDTPSVKISRKKDRTVVAVNGPMTIGQAGELRAGLLKAFDLGKLVELSLTGVTEVDITGLQLICSSHKTSLLKDVALSITGDGENLSSVARVAGMVRHAGCAHHTDGICFWMKEA